MVDSLFCVKYLSLNFSDLAETFGAILPFNFVLAQLGLRLEESHIYICVMYENVRFHISYDICRIRRIIFSGNI